MGICPYVVLEPLRHWSVALLQRIDTEVVVVAGEGDR